MGEANRPRGEGQGKTHHGLPQEQETHEAAEALRIVYLKKILIAAARPRHRSTEFGPYQTVADRDDRTDNPPDHRLRSAHRLQYERNSNERPDADHRENIDHRRRAKTESTFRRGRRRGGQSKGGH